MSDYTVRCPGCGREWWPKIQQEIREGREIAVPPCCRDAMVRDRQGENMPIHAKGGYAQPDAPENPVPPSQRELYGFSKEPERWCATECHRGARPGCTQSELGHACVPDLRDRIAALEAQLARERGRLSETAQILIDEVGCTGGGNAEDAARLAIARVAEIRKRAEKAEQRVRDLIPERDVAEDEAGACDAMDLEVGRLTRELASAQAKLEIAERERQNAFDAHAKLSALVDFPYVRQWTDLVRIIEEKLRKLPAVGGSHVEGTLNGLSHRAQVHLGMEQEKALPDNALIAVLCDTVRMVREWDQCVMDGIDAALRARDVGRVERVARAMLEAALDAFGFAVGYLEWGDIGENLQMLWLERARALLKIADGEHVCASGSGEAP
jgi:hypothetical protein